MSHNPEIERLRNQATALSRFGGHALRSHDLNALLHEAAEFVHESIGVELVKVLELAPDQGTLLVRAGVNWDPGVVGHARLGAHDRSPAGYALSEKKPVISPDTTTEDRFDIPELLVEHGVISMVNVVIEGDRAAWGVLEVDSRQHRDFNEDDISLLQNYANLLAAAIDRLRAEADLRDAADRRSILLGELQHRVRNLLLNVRALARRTVSSSASLDEFAIAFDARLLALARTQELLTRRSSVSVRLEDTLREELKAHGADLDSGVVLSGPDVRLLPKVAQALGLGFHELATNASKYGALRHRGARLSVSWQMIQAERADEVHLVWRESGVPMVAIPDRRGFGSETIERSLPYMLDGHSSVEFHPDGVEWIIRFPLADSRDETSSEELTDD